MCEFSTTMFPYRSISEPAVEKQKLSCWRQGWCGGGRVWQRAELGDQKGFERRGDARIIYALEPGVAHARLWQELAADWRAGCLAREGSLRKGALSVMHQPFSSILIPPLSLPPQPHLVCCDNAECSRSKGLRSSPVHPFHVASCLHTYHHAVQPWHRTVMLLLPTAFLDRWRR